MTMSNGSLEMRNGTPEQASVMTNGNGNINGNGVHSPTSSDDSDSSQRSTRPAYTRKMSTPLAPPFMVSAPGKVIVYGEHAVVHGKVINTPSNPSCLS